MDIVYTLGISSLWDEVCHMPVGGVWWLNVDRYADAVSLMNQTLESQAQDSKVAAIVMGKNPKEVMSLKKDRGPNKIALFTMPDRPERPEGVAPRPALFGRSWQLFIYSAMYRKFLAKYKNRRITPLGRKIEIDGPNIITALL